MDKENILKIIGRQMPYLRDKYRVKQLGIFGSAVRGEETKESDVDILVEFDSPIGFFDFIRLEIFLTKTLGKKADLISKRALKPAIKEGILKEVSYV